MQLKNTITNEKFPEFQHKIRSSKRKNEFEDRSLEYPVRVAKREKCDRVKKA